MERCKSNAPVLEEVEGHLVACHLYSSEGPTPRSARAPNG